MIARAAFRVDRRKCWRRRFTRNERPRAVMWKRFMPLHPQPDASPSRSTRGARAPPRPIFPWKYAGVRRDEIDNLSSSQFPLHDPPVTLELCQPPRQRLLHPRPLLAPRLFHKSHVGVLRPYRSVLEVEKLDSHAVVGLLLDVPISPVALQRALEHGACHLSVPHLPGFAHSADLRLRVCWLQWILGRRGKQRKSESQ